MCVLVTGRSLPMSSTQCSIGISILHRKGCDSTRALPRCLPIKEKCIIGIAPPLFSLLIVAQQAESYYMY